MARRLTGTRVTVNALHPGVVGSGFATNNGSLVRLGLRLFRPFTISPEQGAQTSIYLAASPEVEGITGKYFVERQAVPSSPTNLIRYRRGRPAVASERRDDGTADDDLAKVEPRAL